MVKTTPNISNLSLSFNFTDIIIKAGAATPNDVKDPLSLPLASFTQDFTINTTSAFVAAQQAVLGFKNLPDSASRTFIYTGNSTNITPIGPLLTLGVGKSATAHIIHSAATAYADQGFKYGRFFVPVMELTKLTKYRFYYGDERKADGSPAYLDIDGEAHGKFYLQLSEDSSQGPWQQTFVKGVGYKQF